MKLFKNQKEKELDKGLKYVKEFRKEIPEDYNQAWLLDELFNDEIDHYVSISNRSDGKTFNYIDFFMEFSIDFQIGFTLLCRHYTLRKKYVDKLFEICRVKENLDENKLLINRTDFYTMVIYDDNVIGIITDLNTASDLKYSSGYMKEFPIILYDEFLTLPDDYEMYEWAKLQTIYESVNRDFEIPFIHFPKIFFLGNAVNFDSPVLSELDLFNALETQKINTMKIYDNVIMEMRRNDHINEKRNLRAFKSENDAMTTAQFDFNNYMIATNLIRKSINKSDPFEFYVKLRVDYMKIVTNKENTDVILSIVSQPPEDKKKLAFCMLLKDKTDKVSYIDERFYDPDHEKKYEKEWYYFDNAFSKTNILEKYADLDIMKLISFYESDHEIDTFEEKERIYEDHYIRDSKRKLVERWFG